MQEEWAAHPPRERGEILRRAFEAMTEQADDLALIMTLEMGKTIAESKAEITYASEFFRWFAEEAVRIEGRFATAPNGAGRLITMRQPVGPCYAITPWNFPAAMGTRKIGPAVAAGCTMVIKPAQQTPLTMYALAKILEDAGLPPGVLNVVTSKSSSDVSKPIIGDPRLRKLTFTGSTEVGRKLVEQSAEGLLRTSMELGGNAPFLVFADADVDAAVEGAVIAKMRNIGEACTAANRFHVADKVRDEFTEKLAAKLGEMKVGRGTEEGIDVGPLIDGDQRGKVDELVQDAAGKGADVVLGGHGARRRRLLLRADRAGERERRRAAAQGGDLRPGRAGDRVRRRGRGDRGRQRHRVRPRLLRLHVGHQARVPRLREARDRHDRPQPGPRVQPGGAVRRRQGVRLRPRGRRRGHPRVPGDQVRRDGDVSGPLDSVRGWFDEAVAAGLAEPEAMALATATPDGAPSVRIVLMKGIDDRGVRFFTNYDSRKGRELAANPRAAATLHWQPLARAVRLEGAVERLTAEESDEYFASRGRGSRLGAWASKQSTVIESRETLLASLARADASYPATTCRARSTGAASGSCPTSSSSGRAGRPAPRPRALGARGGAWRSERLSP